MKNRLLPTLLFAFANSALFAADTSTVQPVTAAQPRTATPIMNCEYHIAAKTKKIDPNVISHWAEKAAMQSFDFSFSTIDTQLTTLKPCYTEQGWQSFNDALKQSGNIKAIKSQHLNVSSQRDGELKIMPLKENQWKVSLPLQVVYQNDKQRLTQLLAIDLVIGRKITGDLGIMQLIAAPRQVTQANPTTAASQ